MYPNQKHQKKIVILGGGIAGLALAIFMEKKGFEVIINERFNEIPRGSNAFMMHEEGIEILKSILQPDVKIPGKPIDQFILKRPDETEVKYTQMESWQCMKRRDLIEVLMNELKPSMIRYNRVFSHFIHERGKAVAAVFEDGSTETGDIFVGADGCNSQVRQLLFGETNFSATEVQEILGVVRDPKLIAGMQGVFTKYQDAERGLSFGCIPLSDNEAIWFTQFDVSLFPITEIEKENLKGFTQKILHGFPEHVLQIVDSTDFSGSYLWQTKDFDPLPRFHKQNIVLMGDAAHLALPFTSAGTTNALYDAMVLAEAIESENDLNKAFTDFYHARIDSVSEHVALGRRLKTAFLNPKPVDDKEIEIPLIQFEVKKKKKENSTKLDILYFTDPICSTCWTIQPQLRKMKMKYGDQLNIRYVMGGLLPSWEDFNRGGITKPADVYHHWREVSETSGMPIDGTVWMEDPLHSSFPPSIAFKAAQMQDFDKAVMFLRKMNELVFMQSHNITKLQLIRQAAFETGLDAAILLKDMKGKATELFFKDLQLSKLMQIEVLPTFVFNIEKPEKDLQCIGHDFDLIEKTIREHLPDNPEKENEFSPMQIFKEYASLTQKEFIYLTGKTEMEANEQINELITRKLIVPVQTKAETIYFSNRMKRAA